MTATEPNGDAWLCDVNVLVALVLTTHVHHHTAHVALRDHPGTWASCPLTESALVRLLLNPQVTGRQFSPAEVMKVAQGMRTDPRWRWFPDNTSLTTATIDITVLTGHRQVTDLHLVNLARHHRAVLATFDAGIQSTLAPGDRRWVRVLPQ